MELKKFLEKIEWLESNHPYGGACIRINDETIIYFDPSHLNINDTSLKADLILITHSHDDHFSIKDLKRLVKPTTIIVCPKDCEEDLLQDNYNFNIYVIKSNEVVKLHNIKIKAFPSYSSAAHPNSAGWLGFIIEVHKFKLYHSGDSGFIPEMKELKDIDIAFLTVREPYMMSPKETIKAIEAIKPKIAIPVHWIEEEMENIDYIKENSLSFSQVIILDRK